MKPEDLHNAIGDISDDIVADAKKRTLSPRRAVWISAAALSVCIILTVALIPWNVIFSSQPISNTPDTSYTTKNDETTEQNSNLTEDPTCVPLSVTEYPLDDEHPFANNESGSYAEYTDWRKEKNERFYAYQKDIADISEFLEKSTKAFLGETNGENLVYSPLNVYMALSMLSETTGGESREQILNALGADSMSALRKNANTLWKGNYRDDGIVTSILGGSLWFNEDVNINKNVAHRLATDYYASSYYGKMGTAEFDAAIQKWLNVQTGGLLKDRIGNIKTNPEDIMCLATTIYYKAAWENEFNSKYNTEDIFYSDSKNITCEFMNTELRQAYYDGEHFRATALDFKDGGKMWFLLPDENVNVDSLFSDNDAIRFMTGEGQSELDYIEDRAEIILSVPKFDVSSSIDLSEGLKNLGVSDVFNEYSADFSPLTDVEDIFLKKASHDARVKIDEEGCEAAAYTLLLAGAGGSPDIEPVKFTLDRPFIFVIMSDVDLPLFVGVVNNPS